MRAIKTLKFTRNINRDPNQWHQWVMTADNEEVTVWSSLRHARAYAQANYILPKRSPKGFTQIAAQMQ